VPKRTGLSIASSARLRLRSAERHRDSAVNAAASVGATVRKVATDRQDASANDPRVREVPAAFGSFRERGCSYDPRSSSVCSSRNARAPAASPNRRPCRRVRPKPERPVERAATTRDTTLLGGRRQAQAAREGVRAQPRSRNGACSELPTAAPDWEASRYWNGTKFRYKVVALAARKTLRDRGKASRERGFSLYRGDRTRTCNPRFWRPVLCQLSYAPLRFGSRLYSRPRESHGAETRDL
jgi:hypothetical protein